MDFWSSEFLNSYLNFGIPDFDNSYFIILNLGITTFGILIHILELWFKFWNSELGNSTQFREFRILEILILEHQIYKLNFKWSTTLCNFLNSNCDFGTSIFSMIEVTWWNYLIYIWWNYLFWPPLTSLTFTIVCTSIWLWSSSSSTII